MNTTKRAAPLDLLAGAALLTRSLSRPGFRNDPLPLFFRPVAAWAGRRALAGRARSPRCPSCGRFTRADVDLLLAEVWRRYDEEAPHLPAQPTVGSRMNLRFACLTVALFRALLGQGVERPYALELVSDFTWTVYRQWSRLARLLGRLSRRPEAETSLATRLRPDGTVALRFPFNPPGSVARHVPSQDGVAFDVVRCAIADYFRAQGAADLCLASWCNLDYALGEMLGLTFHRTTTLVEGADRCDMRWVRRDRASREEVAPGAQTDLARESTRQPTPPRAAAGNGASSIGSRDVQQEAGRASASFRGREASADRPTGARTQRRSEWTFG